MRRVAIAAAAVGVLAAACQWVLPERYAVNVPLRSVFGGTISPAPEEFAARIRVPDGFAIGHWATDLPGVRFLRFTDAGDLLASVPGDDRIEILWRDDDGDGVSDGRQILLADLDRPHGIDLYDGWLYVGETGAVGRIRFDAAARATRGSYQRLVTGIPTGGHWTRTVRVGPDAKLYVSIGSSCNVCAEADPRRAAIVRYALDGSQEEIYATGLRNAVGFDWQPNTGALYATDNGRDLLGDDFPPCELDRVVAGGFYGWPYVNGFGVPDPDWGDAAPERVRAARPPAHGFPAHTAPLGLHFVRSDTAPRSARGTPRLLESDREGRLQGGLPALVGGRRHRAAGLRQRLRDRRRRDRATGGRRRGPGRRDLRLGRLRRGDLPRRRHRERRRRARGAPVIAGSTGCADRVGAACRRPR